jgi:hypothetical protein
MDWINVKDGLPEDKTHIEVSFNGISEEPSYFVAGKFLRLISPDSGIRIYPNYWRQKEPISGSLISK